MTDYDIHEFCALFPVASDQDTKMLVQDIRRHGLLDAITIFGGKILDGRNRYTACKILNIVPRYVEFDGDDEAALDFVVSKNLARRHLNESQRAMIAGRLANMPIGRYWEVNSANLPNNPVSQSVAAQKVNVSTRSVTSARKVLDSKDDDLVAAVESGDLAVSVAADVAALPPEVRKEIVRADDKKGAARTQISRHKKPVDPAERQLKALHKAWDAADSDARARFLENIGVTSFVGIEL